MSGPRFHVPHGRRAPDQRRERSDADRWLAAIQEAQQSRADLAVSVAVDGVALIASRSIEDADHAVSVSSERRVVRCSCWAWRRTKVCAHAALVCIWLWEEDFGADLSQVGARALVSTIVNGYLPLPKRNRPWTQRLDHSAEPERRWPA